jgi:hypothetical protein
MPHTLGSCFDVEMWLLSSAICNTIIDWSILFLHVQPLYRVVRRLDKPEMALVCASFAMGLIACMASTTRAALTSTVTRDEFSSKKTQSFQLGHANLSSF